MKTYFKPVFLMGGGGDGDLYPPGHEGSVGDGDGGEWGTGGDGKRSVFTPQSVNVFTEAAPIVEDVTTLPETERKRTEFDLPDDYVP